MKLIDNIRKYLGWRNWAVFVYNSFIEHIFVVFYIALARQDYSNDFIFKTIFFYIFSLFSTSYGYLINDLADKNLDALQGKPNTFHSDSLLKSIFIVFLVFSGSIIFALPFIHMEVFLIFWVLWIAMTTFYSVKPLRLKERGTIGLINVVLAQRVLPILIVFSAFNYFEFWAVLIITAYIFLRGFASDINHQLEDYRVDSQTSTKTFAVKKGYEHTQTIFYAILEAEKILLFALLILIGLKFYSVYRINFHPVWGLLLIYAGLYLYALFQILRKKRHNPFIPEQKNIFQFIHHPFPTIILPAFLLLHLIYFNFAYIVWVLLIIWNKRLFSPKILLDSYPVRALKKMVSS